MTCRDSLSTVAVTIAIPLSDVRRFLVIFVSEGTGEAASFSRRRAFFPAFDSEPESESESESESEVDDDELDDEDSSEDESSALDLLDFTAAALVGTDVFAAEVSGSFSAVTFTASSSELLSSLEESLPDDSVLLVSLFAESFDFLSFTSGSELDEESSSESSELELEDGEGAFDLGGAALEDFTLVAGLTTGISESELEDSESEDDDDDAEGAVFLSLLSCAGSGTLDFEVGVLEASFFLVSLELESAEESESESEESEESEESDSASEDESESELESESEESPLVAFLYRSTITSRLGPDTVTSSLRITTSFTVFFKTEAALVCL